MSPYWQGWSMYERGEMPPFEDDEQMEGYRAARRGHAASDTFAAAEGLNIPAAQAERDAQRAMEQADETYERMTGWMQ